jgi:hypothetical protein
MGHSAVSLRERECPTPNSDPQKRNHLLFETGSVEVLLEVRLALRQRAKTCSFPPKQISWMELKKPFNPDGSPIQQVQEMRKMPTKAGHICVSVEI